MALSFSQLLFSKLIHLYDNVNLVQVRIQKVADTMCDMTEADCRKLDQILAVEEERISSLQAAKDKISSSQADLLEAKADSMSTKFADLKKLQEIKKKEVRLNVNHVT